MCTRPAEATVAMRAARGHLRPEQVMTGGRAVDAIGFRMAENLIAWA